AAAPTTTPASVATSAPVVSSGASDQSAISSPHTGQLAALPAVSSAATPTASSQSTPSASTNSRAAALAAVAVDTAALARPVAAATVASAIPAAALSVNNPLVGLPETTSSSAAVSASGAAISAAAPAASASSPSTGAQVPSTARAPNPPSLAALTPPRPASE